MATREELIAEAKRRQARRELEAGRNIPGATPGQGTPATTPQDVPTAQEVASASGATRQPAGDVQFPVTVGKAALPSSVNKIMEERGMGYNQRADALIGKAVADIGHGVKQLTTGLDEGDVADVEAWRALREGAGMGEGEGEYINAGTVGDISGAIGAFAVPLGAAEQTLVKLGSALPRWASKMGAAATVGGAEGAAQPVLEGESRAVNAAIGAALPTALSAAAQGGRRILTEPFKLSRPAETLVEEGVMPTLGQGVETGGFRPFAKLAKNIEENLEGILPGVEGGRMRAEQEVVNALARRAVPPGATAPNSTPGTPEYFKDVDSLFDDAYKEVIDNMGGRFNAAELMMKIEDAISSEGMMVNPSIKRQMNRIFSGVLDFGGANVAPKRLREFQGKVRKWLSKYSSIENANENTTGAVEILSRINDEISGMVEARLGPEMAQTLKNIDLAYANKMLIETASGFKRRGEHIPVANLDRAIRQRTGRSRRIRGGGLGQDIIDPAFEAMGGAKAPRWLRALSGVGAGITTALAPKVTAIPMATVMMGTRRGGAELLFGLGQKQQQVRRFMDEVVEPKIGTATALISDNED